MNDCIEYYIQKQLNDYRLALYGKYNPDVIEKKVAEYQALLKEDAKLDNEEQAYADRLSAVGYTLIKYVDYMVVDGGRVTYGIVDGDEDLIKVCVDTKQLEEWVEMLEKEERMNIFDGKKEFDKKVEELEKEGLFELTGTKKIYYTYDSEDWTKRKLAEDTVNEIQVLSGILFRLLDGAMIDESLKSDDIDLESLWEMLQDLWDGSYILQSAEEN